MGESQVWKRKQSNCTNLCDKSLKYLPWNIILLLAKIFEVCNSSSREIVGRPFGWSKLRYYMTKLSSLITHLKRRSIPEYDGLFQNERLNQCDPGAGWWPVCVQTLPDWFYKGDFCRKKHVKETCKLKTCNKTCSLRHPEPWKYFARNKFCKFGESCCYDQSSPLPLESQH